jgi:putative thioredoxin
MSTNVVHVSETDFQFEVLAHSSQRPVVVDFWAEWCVPCRTLDPILEKLADEATGAFRLAKLDVDANPKIAEDYGVRGLPSVKVFRNGQVVAEFSGLRSEAQMREFLKGLAPSSSDLAVGRANSLLSDLNWSEGETLFRKALKANPDHPGALLGLARSLLAQGQAEAALPILREFPVSNEYAAAEQLLPLAQAMADLDLGALDRSGDDEALFAVYTHALRLASGGQILAAMDGLLEVLKADKKFQGGEARRIFLGLLQVLGEENSLTREYRNELARLLF